MFPVCFQFILSPGVVFPSGCKRGEEQVEGDGHRWPWGSSSPRRAEKSCQVLAGASEPLPGWFLGPGGCTRPRGRLLPPLEASPARVAPKPWLPFCSLPISTAPNQRLGENPKVQLPPHPSGGQRASPRAGNLTANLGEQEKACARSRGGGPAPALAPLGFVQLQPESSQPLGSRPLALARSFPVPASRCEGLSDGEAEGSRCWEAAGTGWDFPAAAPAGAGGKEAASLRSSPVRSLPGWCKTPNPRLLQGAGAEQGRGALVPVCQDLVVVDSQEEYACRFGVGLKSCWAWRTRFRMRYAMVAEGKHPHLPGAQTQTWSLRAPGAVHSWGLTAPPPFCLLANSFVVAHWGDSRLDASFSLHPLQLWSAVAARG